jgi:hypothetical protein
MFRIRFLSVLFLAGFLAAVPLRAQPGKTVFVAGGSEVDHQLNEIGVASDPVAVDSLTNAAPLLKSNSAVYARNQYRLGFAYLNLRKTADAKQAFTGAASVDSPYKGPAQDKLKGMAAAKAPAKKVS